MKIVIIGCGNVGKTLAEQLSKEGHNVSVIDLKEDVVKETSNESDVLGVIGNGISVDVQKDAGAEKAKVLIAVTGNDEINLLSCIIGKKFGIQHTIARVSDPNYDADAAFIKSSLGLSLIINPQRSLANEIVKLMKFPSAVKIETFPRSKVEIVTYRIQKNGVLAGLSLREMSNKYGRDFIVSAVERDGQTIIPRGDFVLEELDSIYIMACQSDMLSLFKKLGVPTSGVKNAMIAGGGRTATYMVKALQEMGVNVTVIDKSKEACDKFSSLYPKAMVICGDCTIHDLLIEEGIEDTEAFIALTNIDEVNIMLALFAKTVSKAKLVTRIHRTGYEQIIRGMDIGSAMFPKYIATEAILKYVRGIEHSGDSEMETLYRLTESGAEALEFMIKPESPIVGIPIRNLELKKNMLIASITHEGVIEIPRGDSVIQAGDMVVLVTTASGIHSISDALK